jgi:septum formation protein
MAELILASTSAWRRRMLEDAGLRVRCEAPDVDERATHDPDPAVLAARLATLKARAVARRVGGAYVLGADQVVTDGVAIWGKPVDADDHRRRLRAMRGRSHELVTGFTLIRPDGEERGGIERTRMHARADVTDAELDAYVASGEGSGCAGGYAFEGRGNFLFERIEGDYWNVIGLPLLRVVELLRAEGWRYGPGGLEKPDAS